MLLMKQVARMILPIFGVVETGLHHHGVNHRDGGCGERNAGDLGLRPGPARDEMRPGEHTEIDRKKNPTPPKIGQT
jgi:hypothetical protein